MPSLDGHSLHVEIQKLRSDMNGELLQMREAFRELYAYMAKLQKAESKKEGKQNAKPNSKRKSTQAV